LDSNITHCVCARHFTQEDFLCDTIDKKANRRGAHETEKLQRLWLKRDAIHHVFPDLPQYLSKSNRTRPTASATAAARLEKEKKALSMQNDMLLQQEKFEDFYSFKKKM